MTLDRTITPNRQAVLDRVDSLGPVTTLALIREGLCPRAAVGLYSDGHLTIGAEGYERPHEAIQADRPTPPAAPAHRENKAFAAPTNGGCVGDTHKPLFASSGTWSPSVRGRTRRRLGRHSAGPIPARVVAELAPVAVAAERAGRFGTSKIVRRMLDTIEARWPEAVLDDAPADDVSEAA